MGKTPPRNRTALILTNSLEAGRLDRSMLRRLGFADAVIAGSGVQAAQELAKSRVALVVCHEQLEDMSGHDFARLVRLHPNLAALPLIIACTDDVCAAQAVAAGFWAVLRRPYSLNDLTATLRRILALRKEQPAHVEGASEKAFAEALHEWKTPKTPEPTSAEWAEKGQAALRTRRFADAKGCFETALQLDPESADAHYGMAKYWKELGRPDKQREHLLAAAELCIENDPARADGIFAQLRRIDPHAPDPVHSLAEHRLKQGDYEGAARAVSMALKNDKGPEVYGRIARACLFTNDPASAARNLCSAMSEHGQAEEARVLRRRIAGAPKPAPEPADYGPAPKPATNWLGEMSAVARYTLRAYRQGRAEA